MPSDQSAALDEDLKSLTAQGYKVTTTQVEQTYAEAHPGWLPYRIEVQGADHEGIINEVAAYLSLHGINIESMDSETTPAPITGVPLFTMTALVVVPPSLPNQEWEAGLEDLGSQMNLEVEVSAVKKQESRV
jgi:glycine cleavage system transcriptional repressor